MIDQEQFAKFKQTLPSDSDIIQILKNTYLSNKTTEIAHSEAILDNLRTQEIFIEKLFQFLQTQSLNIQRQEQFKRSVSIQIKKFSYQFSKNQHANKQNLIQKLFYLLISKLDTRCKQQLGTALEYFLNHDLRDEYRHKVVLKICQMLSQQSDETTLEGLTISSLACLNSLIEAEDQFQFFHKVYESFTQNLMKIMQVMNGISQQNIGFSGMKKLLKLCQKIFQLFQVTIERLIDEQDYIEDKLSIIRQNSNFQVLLFTYLSNFNNSKSIISSIPEIDSIKQIVVNIVSQLYNSKPMPEDMFNIFFITFLLESSKEQFQSQQSHIICKTLQILQNYLKNKFYLQTFSEHKMQTMMSLLMYLSTKPQQIDMLDNQPERLIQLTEDVIEPIQRTNNNKVKASAFLKMFVSRFDQALKNIMEIVVIIITASMETNKQNSPCVELYNNLREQFPDFPFFKLDISLQLQTSFIILSILSPYISKRKDLNDVVYAVLVTHFENFKKIEQPIVLLRFIRLISYYPTAAYYDFIKQKMAKGKVFVLEGLKTFEKILKANRYPHVFDILSSVFTEIFNLININDSIFQTIILNHYQRVLKKSQTLYKNFLIKIRDTFIQSIEKSQHISLMALGYIYSILYKQQQSEYRQEVMKYFYEMQAYRDKLQQFYKEKCKMQQDPPEIQSYRKILKNLNLYEDKIVDVYCIMAKKQTQMSESTMNFAYKQLKNLKSFNKNDQIWKFYNNIILKFDILQNQISYFYHSFLNQITDIFGYLLREDLTKSSQIENVIQSVPNLCFFVSQILASFPEIHLEKDDLMKLLKIINSLNSSLKQHLCFVILTYTYLQPRKMKEMLLELGCYEQTLKLMLKNYFSEKILRKTFLLAMAAILEIEDNYFMDILNQCVIYFKQQAHTNKKKHTLQNKQYLDPKLRRMFQDDDLSRDKLNQQQQQMIEQTRNDKTQYSISSHQNMKHPFENLSEYDQWKIRIWHNPQILSNVDPFIKDQLREILQMDWIGKGLRKIVTVKQPENGRTISFL